MRMHNTLNSNLNVFGYDLILYKRLLDNGTLKYDDIENSFKSWISDNYKIMSREQINNMSILYYKLFGRLPSWKKGRIKWLMRQAIIGCNA